MSEWTEDSLGALLEAFLDRTLPAEQWTHHAHLLVGTMLARRLPQAELLPFLRQAISSYNLASGGQNTDSAGYHESITAFYASVLGVYARRTAHLPMAEAGRRLLESPLEDRKVVLRAYQPETLKTVAARLGYAAPDVPGFDADLLVAEAFVDAD
jgi:hypothetical protein